MGHVYNIKKQFRVQIIGILEENIYSFNWPKMHLWKGAKKFGQGPSPPPIWTKSKRRAVFFLRRPSLTSSPHQQNSRGMNFREVLDEDSCALCVQPSPQRISLHMVFVWEIDKCENSNQISLHMFLWWALWIWEREYPNLWFLLWGTLNMWEDYPYLWVFVMRHSKHETEL